MSISKKFVVTGFVFSLALVLCVSDAMAQGGGRGGRGGRGGFGGRQGGQFGGGQRGGGGLQGLLRREDVQKELELSEDQISDIREVGNDREGMREMMQELRDMSAEERREKMQEFMRERNEDIQSQLSDILLPHQMKRLKQISTQASAAGGARALTRGSLAEELGLSEEQIENINEKSRELQEELNEKIAKLREEMQKELLGELTSEQRKKYEAMMGDKFTFERQERGGRGGAGGRGGDGGRGGRGGDGGRGGRRGNDGGDGDGN